MAGVPEVLITYMGGYSWTVKPRAFPDLWTGGFVFMAR